MKPRNRLLLTLAALLVALLVVLTNTDAGSLLFVLLCAAVVLHGYLRMVAALRAAGRVPATPPSARPAQVPQEVQP